MLTISIADRGPGLPPGDEQRVFDKFYRANSAQGGVGLGLTICRAIIAAHDGRIWAANRPGGGAVFRYAAAGWHTATALRSRRLSGRIGHPAIELAERYYAQSSRFRLRTVTSV